MNKVICPACGSSHLKQTESVQSMQLTLAPEFEVITHNYLCETCGEEGDFSLQNDNQIGVAVKEAQKVFVKHTLSELEDVMPLVRIERALEIPFRTMNRWKSGDFSAPSIALLRILKTYPWIINVAEDRFSKESSTKYLYSAGLRGVSTILADNKMKMSWNVDSTQSGGATGKLTISQEIASDPNIYEASNLKLLASGN